MSKGPIALVGLLFLITTLVIIITALIGSFLAHGEVDGFFSGMWISLMHAIDAGTITADDGSAAYMILMSIVTICGLFITSVLISIINTGFESKMINLRKGKSKVLSVDHVVLLGFNETSFTILDELIEANLNQKIGIVVIMDDIDKTEMEDAIKARIPDTKTTKIICRSGKMYEINDLEICSIDNARSVIINTDNDYHTIMSILATTSILKNSPNTKAYVCGVIQDEANLHVARIAGEGYAEILYFKEMISNIIAQTCLQNGLLNVFSELFSYVDNEIYCEELSASEGKTFEEICMSLEVSSAIGVEHGQEILINPPHDRIIEKGDKIILIADDDGVSSLSKEAISYDKTLINVDIANNEYLYEDELLIFGCSELLKYILKEIDGQVRKGFVVKLTSNEKSLNSDYMSELAPFENIKLQKLECDLFDRDSLSDIVTERTKNILILSEDDETPDESDAKTLLLLLHLRDLASRNNYLYSITTEMKSVNNQKLASVANANDFVISNSMTSLIVTQISQQRQIYTIYEELLRNVGSEIHMKPAKWYVKTGCEVDFATVSMAALKRKELFIGYKIMKADGIGFNVKVNPSKSDRITFKENDFIIVVSAD